MEEWKECKLGDFIKIKHGYAFEGKSISFEDNNIVLVTPGNFAIGGGFQEKKCKFFHSSYPSEYILKENDLIVTMTDLSKDGDTLGYSAKIPYSDKRIYLHNQRIGLVQFINSEVDKDFIYWFMRSPLYQKTVLSTSSGSTVKHTSPDRICEILVKLPPLPTQQKIAAILSSLDDKIELNNKINANLEQQAGALFKNWFVDFEPFGGKMPEGWKVGKLSDIAEITMGQSPDGKSYNEDGIGTVFYQGRAEFGTRFPTRRLFTTEPKRIAKKFDTLMSVRAPVGDLNIANEDCCIGRGLAAIHSKDGHQSFVHYVVLSLRPQLDVFNGEGTVFGCINRDALNNMEVLIPSKPDLNKFEQIVAALDNDIYNRTEENQNLASLRNTLLPKLMNGEIEV